MEAGETMVEIIRSTNTSNAAGAAAAVSAHLTSAPAGETHEGIKQYYIQKIEELQVRSTEKGEEEIRVKNSSSMSRRKVRIFDVCKPNATN